MNENAPTNAVKATDYTVLGTDSGFHFLLCFFSLSLCIFSNIILLIAPFLSFYIASLRVSINAYIEF